MKKRILALALAGTTAFSVFGAAMSANAAWWDENSSHIGANDDAYYRRYTPAGDIHWNEEEAEARLAYVGYTGIAPGNVNITEAQDIYFTTQPTLKTIENANGNPASLPTIPQGTTMYVANPDNFKADKTYYNIEDIDELPGYYATLDDYMTEEHNFELAEKETVNVTDNNVTSSYAGFEHNEVYYVLYTGTTSSGDRYYAYPTTGLPSGNEGLTPVADTDITDDTSVYYTLEADGSVSHDGVQVGLNNGQTNDTLNAFLAAEEPTSGSYYIADMVTANLDEGTNYFHYDSTNMEVAYVYDYTGVDTGVWTDARYTGLDVTDPESYEEVMSTPVESSGVVYLYDYYENLEDAAGHDIDVDDFADAWRDGIPTLMNAPRGALEPERGYTTRGLRGEVIYNWIDFLDSLGIYNVDDEDEIADWAEQTIYNYAYTYYDDSIVVRVDADRFEDEGVVVYYVTGGSVDVYNFAELIENIANMSVADAINSAQTSEMVYLMQQYNKYMDGYVDVKPVDTDDWGDLLVTLLEAPTADDFRTANSYNRYLDQAESLIEDYQDATTALEINRAEAAMYNFVTSSDWSWMNSSGDEDTAELGAAIDSLFFNYNWLRDDEVYAGFEGDRDGVLNINFVDSDLGVQVGTTMAWDAKSYAMYPADDYANPSGYYTYAGISAPVTGVNDTYAWFVAVYNLAYNIFNNNEFQGTIDAMTSALNEAVDSLTPTAAYNAHTSDILGAEEANEKLADLVETDYTAEMWDNRDKIYTFITDRVSNNEIGEVATNNAEAIARIMATNLGYQRNQSNVTRTDIKSVSTALSEAEDALEALRADEENYNAAQANALEDAIADCEYLIDLYNGDYSTSSRYQSVNTAYNGAVGDKDQILKSDCTDAVEAVDAAINFSNIIMGWSQDKDGNWKYGTEEGYLNDGWHQVDGGKTWFYFNEDGTAKQSEWWQDPATGTWYWFNSNCGAAVGWAKIDGDWYYFKGNNAMKTGWEKVEGSWYYMNSSGKMVTGWCQINGTWYYFSKESNALGQMLANTTTPDGYKVDANGALVE